MPTTLTLAMLLIVPLDESAAPRPLSQIRDEVRSVLRAEVRADDAREREEAIVRLAEIYLEVCRDPRLADSGLLQKEKARMWGRLTGIRRDLAKQLAYSKSGPAPSGRQGRGETSSDDSGVGGQPNNAGAGGGGAISDYGPRLVALIERTIRPDFWDVNGGPGTIFYYQPLHALVIRATDDVHDEIGGVIGGLR
jgi:hypothetical protein